MTMHVLLIEQHNLPPSESMFAKISKQTTVVEMAHSMETAFEKIETLWPNLVILCPANDALSLTRFQKQFAETDLDIPTFIVGNPPAQPHSSTHNLTIIPSDQTEQIGQKLNAVAEKQQARFIRLPNLIIDCHQRHVLRNKQRHILTPKEFKLLHLLLKDHSQILSRKKIMQTVWETDYMGDTRTLDVHIRWIREKIEENPSRPKHLVTVRKMGYRFIMEPD